VTYADMKQITRSKSDAAINRSEDIFSVASALLDKIERRSVRLIGIGLSNFTQMDIKANQLSLFDAPEDLRLKRLDDLVLKLQCKYGNEILMSARDYAAYKNLRKSDEGSEFIV
jgi:hypothetical protein